MLAISEEVDGGECADHQCTATTISAMSLALIFRKFPVVATARKHLAIRTILTSSGQCRRPHSVPRVPSSIGLRGRVPLFCAD
jgi:hypothetical protein